jgi:hypothetical protein
MYQHDRDNCIGMIALNGPAHASCNLPRRSELAISCHAEIPITLVKKLHQVYQLPSVLMRKQIEIDARAIDHCGC